ncbi:alpha/beta hydrolase family protein [Novosphingobium malaysiense]|uniref:hypothetical protein n=1 Tax=Novosphingobium malaysiense TaxID=1348853 RepID=UPI00068FB2DF|nr:hypothetical protein [Novosphingobium malaysiense]
MKPMEVSTFGSFMVGGRLEKAVIRTTMSATEGFPGTIWVDQMYVQFVKPAKQKFKYPVVFVHGGGCTGKCFETKPDGNEGWANYFVRAGFDTYWVDKPWRGRSGFNPTAINRAALEGDASLIPEIHSPACTEVLEAGSWGFGTLTTKEDILIGIKDTVPDFTLALPGNHGISAGGPVVDEALVALLERIGPAILIGHSQGGGEVFAPLRLRPDLVAAVIGVEPAAPPTDNFEAYVDAPVLCIWAEERNAIPGAMMSNAEQDRAMAEGINAAGGHAEVKVLTALGFEGNGHMMLQNSNSDEIAQLMVDWITDNANG